MKHCQKGFSALSTLTKIALTILSLVSGTLTVSKDVFNSDVKGERDTRGRLATVIQGAGIGGGSSTVPKTTPTYINTYIKNRNTGTQYTPAPTYKYTIPVQPTPTPARTPTINSYLENRNTGIQTTPAPTTTATPKPTPVSAPAPAKVCSPGSYSCSGNGRQVCNSSGTGWGNAGTCVCGCSSGTCNTCTVRQTEALTNTIQDFREADQKSMESYDEYVQQQQQEVEDQVEKLIEFKKADQESMEDYEEYVQQQQEETEHQVKKLLEFKQIDQESMEDYEEYVQKIREEKEDQVKKLIEFKKADQESIENYEKYVIQQKREDQVKKLIEFKKADQENLRVYEEQMRKKQQEIDSWVDKLMEFREADQESIEDYEEYVQKIREEKEDQVKKLIEFKVADQKSMEEYEEWMKKQKEQREVALRHVPTCSRGQGCGESWYCNGDLVPGTSGSFASQYCTKNGDLEISSPPPVPENSLVTDIKVEEIKNVKQNEFGEALFTSPDTENAYENIPEEFYEKGGLLEKIEINCTKEECLDNLKGMPVVSHISGDIYTEKYSVDTGKMYEYLYEKDSTMMTKVNPEYTGLIGIESANVSLRKEASIKIENYIKAIETGGNMDLEDFNKQFDVSYTENEFASFISGTQDGYINATSGYRNRTQQAKAYEDSGKSVDAAKPGYSQHHTGLAVDLDYSYSTDFMTKEINKFGFSMTFSDEAALYDKPHFFCIDCVNPGLLDAMVKSGLNPNNIDDVNHAILLVSQATEYRISELQSQESP